MATVGEVGERALIDLMLRHITPMPGMPVPFWDDVMAVSLGSGRAAVLNTDMLVWETDVPPGMTPFQAARKAVVMNFSDLGAKGVQPQAFIASLGIPRETPVCAQDPRDSLFIRYDGAVAPCINLAIGGATTFLGEDVFMPTVHYGHIPGKDLVDGRLSDKHFRMDSMYLH